MKQLDIFESEPVAGPASHSTRKGATARRTAESPTDLQSSGSPSVEALLTSREAAQILKIHPKVLERMAKRGEIPALKVGKFWRYHAATLDAWIQSRLESGRQPCRMKTSF